jgi:hypothetical protein
MSQAADPRCSGGVPGYCDGNVGYKCFSDYSENVGGSGSGECFVDADGSVGCQFVATPESL